MSSLNRIVLVGSLLDDPDVRATNAGDSVANYKLQVDRPSRADGAPSGSDVVPIVAWRQAAEQSQTLQRGQTVMIEGRIQNRTYDDQEGKRHYITEVDARVIHSLGAQGGATSSELNYDFDQSSSSSLEEKSSSEGQDFDFSSQPNEAPFAAPEAMEAADVGEDVPF